LLRIVAGLEQPSDGQVWIGDREVEGVLPKERDVAMVFQSYALYPHKTVQANIEFPLKVRGVDKGVRATEAKKAAGMLGLEPYLGRKPGALSGGQRQRVALARSLAKRPKLLLLDEPLAALDRKLREETRFELKALQQRLQTTFVIVTHDQDEAMTVADRIALMHQGRLAQAGTPVDVYEQPSSRWVAGFVGDVNLIEANVTAVYPSFVTLERDGMRLRAAGQAAAPGPAALALRPEKIRIGHAVPEGEPENGAAGTITDIGYLGTLSVYKVRIDDGLTLKAAVMNEQHDAARAMHVKDRVWLSWAPDAGVVLMD
jgi:putrescine transport system ATP-binding protein